MNEIFERSSIRKFQDKKVEEKKILQILKAGMQAPSARNQQPWEFYVHQEFTFVLRIETFWYECETQFSID